MSWVQTGVSQVKLSAIANKMVFSLHDFLLLPLVFNRCRSSQLSAECRWSCWCPQWSRGRWPGRIRPLSWKGCSSSSRSQAGIASLRLSMHQPNRCMANRCPRWRWRSGHQRSGGLGWCGCQWSQSPPCQCGGRGTSARGACRHLASSHNPRCPRDSSGRWSSPGRRHKTRTESTSHCRTHARDPLDQERLPRQAEVRKPGTWTSSKRGRTASGLASSATWV